MVGRSFASIVATISIVTAVVDAFQPIALGSFRPTKWYSGRDVANKQSAARNARQIVIKRHFQPSLLASRNDISDGEITTTVGFETKDIDSLADIGLSGFHAKMEWISKGDAEKEKEMMRALQNPANTVVARIDGKVIGFLIFHLQSTIVVSRQIQQIMAQNWRSLLFLLLLHKPAKDEMFIFMLAVSPEARGMGVGTKLLGKAYEITQEKGLSTATLHVVEENTSAKRLYSREGFVDEELMRLPPFLDRVFGFRAAWFMRKVLAMPPAQ
jgi:ribosomal protein S18 acetylase RimI-like enzyme